MNTTVLWCWVELEEVWDRPELGWLMGALPQDDEATWPTRSRGQKGSREGGTQEKEGLHLAAISAEEKRAPLVGQKSSFWYNYEREIL